MALEGNGIVNQYVGGYDDWLRQSKKILQLQQPSENAPAKKTRRKQISKHPRKLSFKEKKELETIPKLIETLETEQQQLHDAVANPDFYIKGQEIAAVVARLEELGKQLENTYARWQMLEELQA